MGRKLVTLESRFRNELPKKVKNVYSHLETVNKHEKDSHIVFVEEDHRYFIDGELTKTSCTALAGTFFSAFDSEAIIKSIMSSNGYQNGNSKYAGLNAEEISKEWELSRDLGTKLHAYIEFYINAKKMKVLDNFELDNQDIRREFKQFKKFYEKYSKYMEFYRTEWVIFNTDLKLAGSIDAIAKGKGPLPDHLKMKEIIIPNSDIPPEVDEDEEVYYIVDWKRTNKELNRMTNFKNTSIQVGNNKYPEVDGVKYSIQLNIYREILEREYGIKIGGMILIGLHPENKKDCYIAYKVPFLKDAVNFMFDDFKDKDVSTK